MSEQFTQLTAQEFNPSPSGLFDTSFICDPDFYEARKLAWEITKSTYNGTPGTGYQYFRSPEGYMHTRDAPQVVLFCAVEFDFLEAAQLAGPFECEANGRSYGLVSVKFSKNPIKISDLKKKYLGRRPSSISYMHYMARKRLEKLYGTSCKFYWDPLHKESYSELDVSIPSAIVELNAKDPNLIARLEQKNQCSLFFNTFSAYTEVCKQLTATELKEWHEAVSRTQDECYNNSLRTACTELNPYSLRLTGTDDCSWTQNFESAKAVKEFIIKLEEIGMALTSKMAFTN